MNAVKNAATYSNICDDGSESGDRDLCLYIRTLPNSTAPTSTARVLTRRNLNANGEGAYARLWTYVSERIGVSDEKSNNSESVQQRKVRGDSVVALYDARH